MIATDERLHVGLAEWIIDDTCLVMLNFFNQFQKYCAGMDSLGQPTVQVGSDRYWRIVGLAEWIIFDIGLVKISIPLHIAFKLKHFCKLTILFWFSKPRDDTRFKCFSLL